MTFAGSEPEPVNWPYIDPDDTSTVETEVLAEFPKNKPWRNPGFPYNNFGTALRGDDGADKLFTGTSKNGVERKHGLCQFFAVAERGKPSIVVTLDGVIAILLSRMQLGDRSLKEIQPNELKSLCASASLAKRRLDSFP